MKWLTIFVLLLIGYLVGVRYPDTGNKLLGSIGV